MAAPARSRTKRNASPLDRDRRGPGAVEYCLVAALISIIAIAMISALGASLQSQLDALSHAIAAPNP